MALLTGLVAAAAAAQDDLEDELSGFEDEAAPADDDPLGGFEDEAAPAEDDSLGGFDEAGEPGVSVEEGSPLRGEWWEITGSLGVAGSVNYVAHRSATGNTNYKGLSKLRTRLNLQVDLDLPREWELRAEGFAYYDWAYLIRGRSNYTQAVLDEYEWDADTQDFWIRGSLLEHLDLKLGRQVVNWGRSDSLRVLDVLNPLDNREPGIADIEDLRRSVTMGRLDYYWGSWNLSLIAIPEIRFNQDPPPGSDFNPTPGPPLSTFPVRVFQDDPDSLENWEAGVGLTGIFEGWDVSFHFAYHFEDLAVLDSVVLSPSQAIAELKHSRLWMVGAGGNYTFGSWLLKGELAYLDGLIFTGVSVPGLLDFDPGTRSRLDAMLGVEYYGLTNTTLSIEVVHRHIFDFPTSSITVGNLLIVRQEDDTQAAFRLTRSFMNERFDASVVAILLSGIDEVGSVVRIDGSYDLRDALVLTAGFVLYQESDLSPLDSYGDNDRFFFELKYSF